MFTNANYFLGKEERGCTDCKNRIREEKSFRNKPFLVQAEECFQVSLFVHAPLLFGLSKSGYASIGGGAPAPKQGTPLSSPCLKVRGIQRRSFDEQAFKIAGALAVRMAFQQAAPVLMEPLMLVEVYVSEERLREVIGDLNRRRGTMLGIDTQGLTHKVRWHVPLAEMSGYADDLRSLTSGRGSYAMEFAQYTPVPDWITDNIIAKRAGR